MNYREAVNLWGKRRIEAWVRYHKPKKTVLINPSTVSVDFNFNEGYVCCGGTNPDCYCSYEESPSAEVMIMGRDYNGHQFYRSISFDEFDFVTVLEEILEEK